MRVEIFSLCEAATSDGGRLNLLGAFDTIWVREFPAVHPQCAVALRMRFNKIERGERRVTVNFSDADGRNILAPAHADLKVDFPDEQASHSVNLIFNIQGLKIEKPGEYSIDLAIDSRHEASLPVFMREQPLGR